MRDARGQDRVHLVPLGKGPEETSWVRDGGAWDDRGGDSPGKYRNRGGGGFKGILLGCQVAESSPHFQREIPNDGCCEWNVTLGSTLQKIMRASTSF